MLRYSPINCCEWWIVFEPQHRASRTPTWMHAFNHNKDTANFNQGQCTCHLISNGTFRTSGGSHTIMWEIAGLVPSGSASFVQQRLEISERLNIMSLGWSCGVSMIIFCIDGNSSCHFSFESRPRTISSLVYPHIAVWNTATDCAGTTAAACILVTNTCHRHVFAMDPITLPIAVARTLLLLQELPLQQLSSQFWFRLRDGWSCQFHQRHSYCGCKCNNARNHQISRRMRFTRSFTISRRPASQYGPWSIISWGNYYPYRGTNAEPFWIRLPTN